MAGPQHGVLTRVQLLAAGLTKHEIQTRLQRGSLIGVHYGVYRVGHAAASAEASFIAAVLACGAGSLLCGSAAAYLHGLLRGLVPRPAVLTASKRRPAGVKVHRTREIAEADRSAVKSIPVTTIARTLVDLAAVLNGAQLSRACHEAVTRDRTIPRRVEVVLARRRTSPGAATLRRVLQGDDPTLLSELERRFLRLVRGAGLPLPQANRRMREGFVDCRWPDERLTVELDGYRFHSSRHAWEKDRDRERAARARGDEHRRYTWADVVERPERTVAELRELLVTGRATGPR